MATARPAQPIKLYGTRLSGHAHRVELFLTLLGLPYEYVVIDTRAGEQKSPAYLAKNLFGQVPVIEDGELVLPDSNAILVYLAMRYGDAAWLPRDPVGAARVQRWLSVAAGQVAFGPAAARLTTLFGAPFDHAEVCGRAHKLFAVMEQELAVSLWLAGASPTIADIANYSYIAHAPEGGVALDAYPNIRAWLARIEALPGFVGMPKSPLPAAA